MATEDREYRLNVIEVTVSVLTLCGLAYGGWMTYRAYTQKPALQAQRAMNDAKQKACLELSATAAKLLTASSVNAMSELKDKFGDVKHGAGLVLLDKPVLDEAMTLYNSAADALKIPDGPTYRHQVRCTLNDKPFRLALACRQMVARDLSAEGGVPIAPLDPDYLATWLVHDCT